MTPLQQWAHRHNISAQALDQLHQIFDALIPPPNDAPVGSEAASQQRIRLEAPKHGVRLWRNNVGACVDDRGNRIRYGLANESPAMNKKIKSSDLVGITPITITPDMVGSVVGVFTAIECKRPGWKYSPKGREVAQMSFIQLVVSMGGFAQFATGPEDIQWNNQ